MGILDFLFGSSKKKEERPERRAKEHVRKRVRKETYHEDYHYERPDVGSVLNGKIISIETYGLKVDTEQGFGLVHASNVSRQVKFMSQEIMEDLYNVGQTIRVKVLGYDDRGRMSLGIKQLQNFSYKVGDIVDVTIREQFPNGLTAIIDDNYAVCFIPKKEESWTRGYDESRFVGNTLQIKIIGINDDKGLYRITGSIRQTTSNPWQAANLKVGSVINVRVDNHMPEGMEVSAVDNGFLPGFVAKNDVTWLKNAADVAMDDYPETGQTVRVLVKKFDPSKEILKCSIRDLQANPWENMRIGLMVHGLAKGVLGDYTVRLDNGIECRCMDDILGLAGRQAEFIVTDVDIDEKRMTVSHDTAERAEQDAICVGNFLRQRGIEGKSRIFVRNGLVLLPQDVLYGGDPVAMPYATAWVRYLNDHPEKFTQYEIVRRATVSGKELVFVSVDVKDMGMTLSTVSDDALKSQTYPIDKVLCETPNSLFVKSAGKIGWMDKSDIPLDVIVKAGDDVRFVETGSCMRLAHLMTVGDSNVSKADTSENLFMLSDEEMNVLDEQNKALLESFVKDMPGVNKSNVSEIQQRLYISYDPNVLQPFNDFIDKDPDYFSTHNFWLTSQTGKDGRQVLRIFDENNILLVCDATDKGIYLWRFYHDRQLREAQQELNKGKHPLFISAANIKIVRLYDTPASYNVAEARLNISRQYDIYRRLLPSLYKKAAERKRSIAKDYVTMSQFLKFQQGKEKQRLEDIELSIDHDKARVGTKNLTNNPVIIIQDNDCARLFNETDDRQSVKVIRNGAEREEFGTLEEGENIGEYVLSFRYTPDLAEYVNDGFVITPNPNVYHLKIQQRSVEEFVRGDLLTRLDQGKLVEPVEDEGITFFDDKFNHVEPGNNQPTAIRKAVGNKSIFLIQGPPGTGKTSVIVEIIRQLVKKGERVLVCSQAHSAVQNIFDRLTKADPDLKVGFLDEEDTMRPVDFKSHVSFLRHNVELITELMHHHDVGVTDLIDSYIGSYDKNVRDTFTRMHHLLVDYYHDNVHEPTEAILLIDSFREELERMNTQGNGFYTTSFISSRQVVMGTCIGLGTDSSIRKSGVKFDTLIMDEAGKANLAETNVPMQLASKYILVGDDNQLPPYLDTEEVHEFEDSEEAMKTANEDVADSLGLSLFSYFLHHPNFPSGSSVLLNYQYRMNPSIGNRISQLFYDGNLYNGTGTETQTCDLQGFPEAVTFIDTGRSNSVAVHDPYEKSSGAGAIFNPLEVNIVCRDIAPRIENLLAMDGSLTVGIITPYREQVKMLRKSLREQDSLLSQHVYTIDNVQGQEFDIVVISFVRSFRGNRKVGFLDDLRRLNVALSRAKKKLIMVGNLDTLTREEAHRMYRMGNEERQPSVIFRKISEDAAVRYAELNSIDKLRKHGIEPGYVFKDCKIECRINRKGRQCKFIATLDGEELPPFGLSSTLGLEDGTRCDVKFEGYNSDNSDRPIFSVADPVILQHDMHSGKVRLADGSEKNVWFNTNNWLFNDLLGGDLAGIAFPLVFNGKNVSLNIKELKNRVGKYPHKAGDKVQAKVIAFKENRLYMITENTLGMAFLNERNQPQVGDIVTCIVGKGKSTDVNIRLKVYQNRKYYGHK